MPIPFPINNTNWEAPGRPMIFTTNARAYTPIVTDGVTTPTLTITEPTVDNQFVLLSASAFDTFGDVGNQTRQTYRTFEPDGTVKQTIVQTESFGNVTITNFGNQTEAAYDVGVPNVIGTGATNSQGTTWPATSTAAPTYSATCAQAAADSTNTVNNSFVSDQSDAVNFQVGNVHEPVTTNGVNDTGDLTPTFNINTPTSVCGATHSATRWKLWQQTSAGFEGDSPTDDPRTTDVFNNGADCDLTFTEGDGLTQLTFPNNLELVDDNDTTYTLGVQCTFTLDGETFRSPYVLAQFTLQAAINVNIVAANNGTATNNQIDLDDVFTAAQLADPLNKRITVEEGAVIGSDDTAVPALTLTTANTFNGVLQIRNNGLIIGMGGAGGVDGTDEGEGQDGGDAISSQMDVVITNNGTISGGGGGGGLGGQGGNAGTTTTYGGAGCCAIQFGCDCGCDRGCKQYDAAARCVSGCANCGAHPDGVSCGGYQKQTCTTCEASTTQIGGDGGSGGDGSGYNPDDPTTPTGEAAGSAGDAGAGDSGDGGTGGTGGAAGSNGSAGGTGDNGDTTDGVAGAAGGASGNSVQSNGNTVTMTNNGTINGPQV